MTKLSRRSERNQPEDVGLWDPLRSNLVRMDPFRLIRDMFQDPFGGMGAVGESAFRPELDITETGEGYQIQMDLPGVKEADIDISITGNRLTVSGKRESEQTTESERYVTTEIAYGSFSRSFMLPEGADLDHVRADLRNGVLRIAVPKQGETKGRKVAIEGGSKSPELERAAQKPETQIQEQAAGQRQEEEAAKKAA
jgi:HSP20 family protein